MVTDSTEGAIPGAFVTLLNQETGISSTQETNEARRNLADLVQPGK